MVLKFTVHGVQSFIKGLRKSGVISIKHSRGITIIQLALLQWNNVRFLPVTATNLNEAIKCLYFPCKCVLIMKLNTLVRGKGEKGWVGMKK